MKKKINQLLSQLMDLHPKYIDLSLDRLKLLLKKLNNPHLSLPTTIHIAGTNGKGSTLNYLSEILKFNNYSIHTYISPHLVNFNERIIINNKEIKSKNLYETLKYVQQINNKRPITFFEITTAAAFLLFSQNKADFLILETGLGGRLDATNIIPNSLINIITPISFDHQEFLGKSLNKITNEKLGIIKPKSNVIIGKQNNKVIQIIKNKLKNKKNVLYFDKNFRIEKKLNKKFLLNFNQKKYLINKPNLLGEHQVDNVCCAVLAALLIKKNGYKINLSSLNYGILNSKWPGRLELIKFKQKQIFLDGSHNPDGAMKLKNFLEKNHLKPWVLFGMMNNKNIVEFLRILKNQINGIIAIKIPNEKNSFNTNQILNSCNKYGIHCIEKKSLTHGLNFLLKKNSKYSLITGSLYLAGKARKKIL